MHTIVIHSGNRWVYPLEFLKNTIVLLKNKENVSVCGGGGRVCGGAVKISKEKGKNLLR